MSSFGGLYITRQGRTLQSKTIEGKLLKFTGVRLGDGQINGDIEKITDLVNTKIFLDIAKCKTNETGEAIVSFTISNKQIQTGFYMREIGLYAEDPDTKNQILYAYANAGTEAEYIPNNVSEDIINKKVDLILAFENSNNVVVQIKDNLVYVTQDELEEILAQGIEESKKYKVKLSETISQNTDYQIPATYIVGSDNLEVLWEGIELIKDENYVEVGEEGESSNIIQFLDWNVENGDSLVFKIKGHSIRIYTLEEAQAKIEAEYLTEGCHVQYQGLNLDNNYIFTIHDSATTTLIASYIVDRYTLEVEER